MDTYAAYETGLYVGGLVSGFTLGILVSSVCHVFVDWLTTRGG